MLVLVGSNLAYMWGAEFGVLTFSRTLRSCNVVCGDGRWWVGLLSRLQPHMVPSSSTVQSLKPVAAPTVAVQSTAPGTAAAHAPGEATAAAVHMDLRTMSVNDVVTQSRLAVADNALKLQTEELFALKARHREHAEPPPHTPSMHCMGVCTSCPCSHLAWHMVH